MAVVKGVTVIENTASMCSGEPVAVMHGANAPLMKVYCHSTERLTWSFTAKISQNAKLEYFLCFIVVDKTKGIS